MYILSSDKSTFKLLALVCFQASRDKTLSIFSKINLENLAKRITGLTQVEPEPENYALDCIPPQVPILQAFSEIRQNCKPEPLTWELITSDNVKIRASSLWKFHQALVKTYGDQYPSFIVAWAENAQANDKLTIESHGIKAVLEVKNGNSEDHKRGINNPGNTARDSGNREHGGSGKNGGNQKTIQETFVHIAPIKRSDHFD